MHMHSGEHARKRIDFYILLCGIWCFPPFTFFFSPFFLQTDFSYFIFHFSFSKLKLNSSLADCIQKGHGAGCVGEGGRGEAGRLGRAWHRQPALL